MDTDKELFFSAVGSLRDQGKSIRTIAAELGVNRGQVDRALKRLGQLAAEQSITDTDKARSRDEALRDAFVGRRYEMGELRAALEEAISGRGRIVMLAGEPGIGKTRTAANFSAHSGLREAKVFWGRCYESLGTPPYWLWIQAIRSYFEEHDADRLMSDMGPGARALIDIIPELRNKFGGLDPLPDVENAEQARFRLFDSIASLLKKASQTQPIILVFDNLHWADRPSLLLLEFIAQELDSARLLIIGTYRNEDPTYRSPLSQTLGELTKGRNFRSMTLGGLAHEDIRDLLESVCGISPAGAYVDAIHDKSEGNPLFATEIARMLAQEGHLIFDAKQPDAEVVLGIPDGVRDAIGRRLSRLSEGCNEVLTVASIIGREFGLHELEQLIDGQNREQLLVTLEEALSARIIEEAPDAVGNYQFVHVLVQETLAGELTAIRRAELHAKVCEALEESYGENAMAHAEELAHHAAESAGLIGPKKLVQHSLLAGQQAMATYSHEEALLHFQRALEAKGVRLDSLDGFNREDLDGETAQLLSGLGRAQLATFQRHDYQQALANLRCAFRYFGEMGDVERAVTIAEYPKRIAPGVPLGWGDVITRALQLVDSESHHAGRLLCAYGLSLYSEEGDYNGAVQAYDRALVIAQREEDTALEIRALVAAGHAEAYQMHFQRSLQYDLRAVELVGKFPQLEDEWHARMEITSVLFRSGDLQGARNQATATLEVAERMRIPATIGQAIHVNMVVSFLEGDWQNARAWSDRGLAIEPRNSCILSSRAILDYTMGRPDQGRQYLGRLMEVKRATKPGSNSAWGLTAATIPLVNRIVGSDDNSDVAEEAARGVLTSPSVVPVHANTARAGLALLAVQRNDTAAAEEQYAALMFCQNSILGGALDAIISADRLLGLLAQTMGKPKDAEAHFSDALAFCRKAGYRPELAWACYDYADHLKNQGEREMASTFAEESLAISIDLGMRPLADKVTKLRNDIESQPRKVLQYPDGLTRREVDVLRLIAAGKSNREIAEELFLSLRTIERHITNIYTKTNARSKADATAYAFRHDLAHLS